MVRGHMSLLCFSLGGGGGIAFELEANMFVVVEMSAGEKVAGG
jgi:hypothetical protein